MEISLEVGVKKAGRPKSVAPLTPADKQKAYRAKQQQKLEATNSLTAEINILRQLLLSSQEELAIQTKKLEDARKEILRLDTVISVIK